MSTMTISRKWLNYVVAALGVMLLSVAIGCENRFKVAPNQIVPEPFASEGWHSGSSARRNAMGITLERDGSLLGKSLLELRTILGPETKKYGSETSANWELGEQSSDHWYPYTYYNYLGIDFDAQGKCCKVRIWLID
jgi:hypothetical protein